MLSNKITTIGGATRDIMFYTDDMVIVDNKSDLLRKKLIGFEYGAKVYSREVYLVYGGGGMNVAVGLASLGIKTQVILSLGGDSLAQEIVSYLKEKKVATGLIQRRKNINTGVSFVVNVGKFNEHVIFAYRGANNKIDLSLPVVKKINTKKEITATRRRNAHVVAISISIKKKGGKKKPLAARWRVVRARWAGGERQGHWRTLTVERRARMRAALPVPSP